MNWLLCRVLGHQRTLVAFTSNRFSCRRCGADLGRDIPAMPSRPAASLLDAMDSPSEPSPRVLRQRSRHVFQETRRTGLSQVRPRRGGA
jgi:hypothetical protein